MPVMKFHVAIVPGGVSRKQNVRWKLNADHLWSADCGGVKEAGLGSGRSSTTYSDFKNALANTTGSTEAGWPFRVVPNWSGQARLSCCRVAIEWLLI